MSDKMGSGVDIGGWHVTGSHAFATYSIGMRSGMPATMTLVMVAVSADLTMLASARFRCGRSPIQAATGPGSFPAIGIPCLAVEIEVGEICRIEDRPCHTGFQLRAEVVDHPYRSREQHQNRNQVHQCQNAHHRI